MCVCAQSLSSIQLFTTPWTIACRTPLSVEFSRQEYWSGLLFPPPGDLSNPGIKPSSLVSLDFTSGLFTSAPPGKPLSVSECLVTQSCLTLQPMDCSPPGSSVYGILQVSILEWVALYSPGELPDPWVEPRSPALQADSLPAKPSGKPLAPSKWGIKLFIVQIFCLLTQVIKLNKCKIYVLTILLFYILHTCLVTQLCRTFCDPMDCIACQAPLFMGFSRQEYWSGLPFPPPEDLPNPGIIPVSPSLAGRFFTTEPSRKPYSYPLEWQMATQSSILA